MTTIYNFYLSSQFVFNEDTHFGALSLDTPIRKDELIFTGEILGYMTIQAYRDGMFCISFVDFDLCNGKKLRAREQNQVHKDALSHINTIICILNSITTRDHKRSEVYLNAHFIKRSELLISKEFGSNLGHSGNPSFSWIKYMKRHSVFNQYEHMMGFTVSPHILTDALTEIEVLKKKLTKKDFEEFVECCSTFFLASTNYNTSSHSTSLVEAWSVCEVLISRAFRDLLSSESRLVGSKEEFSGSVRKVKRDMTSYEMIVLLERNKVFTEELAQKLQKCRKARNNYVHYLIDQGFDVSHDCIVCATWLLNDIFGSEIKLLHSISN